MSDDLKAARHLCVQHDYMRAFLHATQSALAGAGALHGLDGHAEALQAKLLDAGDAIQKHAAEHSQAHDLRGWHDRLEELESDLKAFRDSLAGPPQVPEAGGR